MKSDEKQKKRAGICEPDGAFLSLLKYYHETGAHDEVIRLLWEVLTDASKNSRLKGDHILYWNIFISIDRIGKWKDHEEVLRALFEKCYSFQYYEICANIGLRLDDKELLQKLIDKKYGYDFNVGEKIKVLEYLKGDYGEEVLREYKKLVSSLLNEMGAHQYKKAAECVLLLWDRMDEEAWVEYVKGLYTEHSGKRNLWSEFKDRGISLKMKKIINMQGNYGHCRNLDKPMALARARQPPASLKSVRITGVSRKLVFYHNFIYPPKKKDFS